jgi:hypothetical protein
MPSINLLAIFNPAHEWRSGYITVPWQPIERQFQIPPEEIVLSDLRSLARTPLLSQIDRVDPEDPTRDVLVFSLAQPVPPGSPDETTASAFVRADRGKPMPPGIGEPYLEVVYDANQNARGVRFVNSRLIVWLNLVPDPENDGRNWFAGAATSVQLDRQEILDPFRAAHGEWMGQDPEKRCLQIAELQLPGLPHPKSPYYRVNLCDRPYRLVSHASGAVRARITIASAPFDYMGADPVTGHNRHLICELYRVISLYAGTDYLVEELFVKGKPKGQEDRIAGDPEVVNLNFAAQYFSHMDMGLRPHIYQIFHAPGWFAVGTSEAPNPGYGFVSNLSVDTLTYPHEEHSSCFSWQLLPGKFAKCVHLFMRSQSEEFDTRTGRCWNELIYQPLKAEIYQDEAAISQVRDDRFARV